MSVSYRNNNMHPHASVVREVKVCITLHLIIRCAFSGRGFPGASGFFSRFRAE